MELTGDLQPGRYLYWEQSAQRSFEIVWQESQSQFLFSHFLNSEAFTGVLTKSETKWEASVTNVSTSESKRWYLHPCADGLLVERSDGFQSQADRMMLSKEWQSVVEQPVAAGETLLIKAAPGSGKSTLLREWCRGRPDNNILLVAFNKAVSEQLDVNFRSELPNVTVQTIHSLAYQATFDLHRGMVGDPTKTDLKGFLECGWDEVEKQQKLLASFCASADCKLGGRHDARTKALHERLWAHFVSGQCRFRVPHNVYLKLFQLSPSLRDPAFQSYDIVVLDEAQDCTDCMLDILKSKRFAQVIACDPQQNIYQFNHVDGKYLAGMHANHRMSLPQSFRFGTEIASFLTRIARANPGPPEAVLEVRGMPSLKTRLEVTSDPTASIQGFLQKNQKVKVLARKNSTLFFEAMRVVANLDDGKTMSFIGGFESFKELQLDPVMDLFCLGQQRKDDMKSKSRNYLARFASLHHFRNKCELDEDVEWLTKFIIYDKVSARGPKSFQEEIKTFENKLAPALQADVVFSTVHQAKGLGFENVVALDDFLDEHTVEEYNIFYVACSRTSTGTLCIAKSTLENLEEHERGRCRGKKRPLSSYDSFDLYDCDLFDFDDPLDGMSQFEEGPEEDDEAGESFEECSYEDGFEEEDDEACEEAEEGDGGEEDEENE